MAPKIVCVVGPTACGKTTLGVLLAKKLDGEVVSADSMQIYRGMTIGTAAPTAAEMDGVPHHMIAVAAPYWDLSYPAALRTYIEYVSANGLAYHYDEHGCHGDCRAKWLVYLTSGGDFEHEDSAGVVHWRQLAAMFGIPRFDYVFAGGLDACPDTAEETLTASCALARSLAAES